MMSKRKTIGVSAAVLLAAFAVDAAFGLPISNYTQTVLVGLVDDISSGSVPEDQAGPVRMTPYQSFHATLYRSDGTEITDFGSDGEVTTPGHYVVQDYRCDNSDSIPGTSGSVGGDHCVTGQKFDAVVDARGGITAGFTVYEYGDGSGTWSVWNCIDPAGSGGTITGVDAPGAEDPNSAPTSAEPDPLCDKINTDDAGAEVTMNGVLTHEVHWADRSFNYLIVRTDNCTGNCDATLQLQVRF